MICKILSKNSYDKLKDINGDIPSLRFSFVRSMSRFCGIIVQIPDNLYGNSSPVYIEKIIRNNKKHYTIEDLEEFRWSFGMFEKVYEKKENKI